MKKFYLLLVLLAASLSFGQTTLKFQDFEGGSDDWNYTATPATYNTSGDVWAVVSTLGGTVTSPQNGNSFWGMRDLANPNGGTAAGGESTLAFPNVDVSGQSNVVLSFYYITDGYDSSDHLRVEVFFDDASQGQEDLLKNTDAWTQYSKAVPAGTNNVRVTIIAIQNGGSDYAGLDNFKIEAGAVANPSLAITDPVDNYVFSPEVSAVDVTFTVQNFNVANGTGDGHISWKLDNGTATAKYDTNPINLTGLSSGAHSVYMELVDNSNNPLNPAVNSTVHFSIATYTQVANLAALRAANLNEYYEVTGEVFIIGGESSQSGSLVGYAQDATAGIKIYAPAGVISTNHDLYDGLTGIKGKLINYYSILELVATADPGASSSTGNTVTPQVVTADELTTNHENYESELVQIVNATADYGTDTQYVYHHNYTLTDASGTTVLRVDFHNLAGHPVRTGAIDVTGIASEHSGNGQILPREESDIVAHTSAVSENEISGLNVYPNPVTNGQLYISSDNGQEKQVKLYDLSGKMLLSVEVNNNQSIQLSNLNAGIYLLEINENGKIAHQKLMIK